MKVLVIGDKDSGKSSLILRYTDNIFAGSPISALGVDFKVGTMDVDGDIVKIQVWDDAQKNNKWGKNYKGVHAIIVTVDMSKQHCIASLQEHINSIDKYANENVIKVIVGTKIDKKSEITKENIKALKLFFDEFFPEKNSGAVLGFVSSKTAENIDELFSAIASEYISRRPEKQPQSPQEIERAKKALIERLKQLCSDQQFWADKIKDPTTIIPDGIKSLGILLLSDKKDKRNSNDILQQIKEFASKKYSYFPFVENLFKGRSTATNELYGIISGIDTSNITKTGKALDDYMKKYSGPNQNQEKLATRNESMIIRR